MAAETLKTMRLTFVENVSEANLGSLLDYLFHRNVINKLEKELLNQKSPVRANQARDFIDTVTNKGDVASELMMSKWKELDPVLLRDLPAMAQPEELLTDSNQPQTNSSVVVRSRQVAVVDPLVNNGRSRTDYQEEEETMDLL